MGDRARRGGDGRTVVVTGTSTGIGRAAVAALTAAGFGVIATVRRQADADSLQAEFGTAVRPQLVDLLDDASIQRLGEVATASGPIYGLVNNAGSAVPGPLEYLPAAEFRRQVETNLTGQLLVTQAVLPALRRSAEAGGGGRIVMVGSIAGRATAPMLGAYSAAKHGLVGVSNALRAELSPWGIQVVLLEPGMIATPIWGRGGDAARRIGDGNPLIAARYSDQLATLTAMAERGVSHGLPPSAVGDSILRCLVDAKPKPRQTIGRDAAALGTLVRLLPFRAQYAMTRARRPGRGAGA